MLTPEKIVESGKDNEHSHQCALMQWIVFNRKDWPDLDLIFAIPNGGGRTMSVAASLKAEGVKAGVPDLFLPVPRGIYAGLWIEMKRPGVAKHAHGGRSEKQVEWHKRLIKLRYAVIVAYGYKSAILGITKYYLGLLQMPADGDSLPVVE
jgi:VRR-NUC domain